MTDRIGHVPHGLQAGARYPARSHRQGMFLDAFRRALGGSMHG